MDLQRRKLLVIAPHPDDEVLGCGGLIKKVKDAGGKVYILYLTVGNTRDFSEKGNSTKSERLKEIKKVTKYLNIDDYHIGFSGAKFHLKLDAYGQHKVMKLVERESPISIERTKPDIIASPSRYSYNQDHQLVSRAVHAALRPAEPTTKHFVKTVLAYEMPADSWSLNQQVVPNFFVRLTKAELDTKLTAMSLYASQMRPSPNPRSLSAIESLAKLRGALAGSQFAEGYGGYRIVL